MSDFNFDTDAAPAQDEDSFEILAHDIMVAFTALLRAVRQFSELPAEVPADQTKAALGVIANMSAKVGIVFALRGAELSGELDTDEDEENFAGDRDESGPRPGDEDENGTAYAGGGAQV